MAEVEAGNMEPEVNDAPPPEVVSTPEPAQSDGPGSGRGSLRKSLEDGFDKARKAAEPPPEKGTPEERRRPGRPRKDTADRVGGRLAGMPDSGTQEAAPAEAEEEVVLDSNPPEGWTPEAKAAWGNVPDEVRAAVLKREQDMNKGVQALKNKYGEIDRVLEPHMQAISQHGHTPAGAVNQLFSWFDALGKNPAVAFPALARSFGYDISQFVRAPNQGQQRQQQQPQAAPQAGQQPTGQQQPQQAPVGDMRQFERRYANYVQQQLQPLQEQIQQQQWVIQQQNQSKTEENVAYWAKDKPYYEDVRERMAYLIGSGAIPLNNGKVDLDRAYEEAVWALPEVRNRILQDQAAAKRAADKTKKEAEAKAQREQADKARQAATSVPISAPGVAPAAKPGQQTRGKSVRETLAEAIEAHRGE